MLIWRLRSAKELSQLTEELDAIVDRKVLLQMYQTATAEKHSFWFVNLLNEQDQMFFKQFDQRMLVNTTNDDSVPRPAQAQRLHERGNPPGP